MLTAKGLTSGYLPMGAVLVAGRVAEPFWESPGVLWRHGYTYSGHAAAAAAAMANLSYLEDEGLVASVANAQLSLTAALSPLRAHSWVSDVRAGGGLLAAVQLAPEVLADDPAVMPRRCASAGCSAGHGSHGGLQISPAFVITRAELQQLASAIDDDS